ncbi:hypothetical protein ACFFUE_00765 [Bergeyella porcorum]|uniref:hypothetical protein n=1 Tax=Bergeyella porcorum TaxID=1735111 RepID=UPI0035E81A06
MNKYIIIILMLSGVLAHAQEGNVGINNMNPQATLHISKSSISGKNQGLIIPNVEKSDIKSFSSNVESTLLYATSGDISDTSAKTQEITKKGFYYYDESSSKWVSLAPKAQFYMPSIEIPMTSNITHSIDLYDQYQQQYDTQVVAKNPSAKNLRVFSRTELDYYITYNSGVFIDVMVSDDGVLTYKVSATATADQLDRAYMNVVFQEK